MNGDTLMAILQRIKRAVSGFGKLFKMNTWERGFDYDRRMKTRYALLLEMVPHLPFKKILDLGCGPQYLRELISENEKYMELEYVGVDLHPHKNDTVICDFNKNQFPDIQADAVFLAGIIEYIYDADWFIAEVSKHAGLYIIGTYNYADYRKRGSCLWVNAFSRSELEQKFEKNGFVLKEFKHFPDKSYLASTGFFLFEKKHREI